MVITNKYLKVNLYNLDKHIINNLWNKTIFYFRGQFISLLSKKSF